MIRYPMDRMLLIRPARQLKRTSIFEQATWRTLQQLAEENWLRILASLLQAGNKRQITQSLIAVRVKHLIPCRIHCYHSQNPTNCVFPLYRANSIWAELAFFSSVASETWN